MPAMSSMCPRVSSDSSVARSARSTAGAATCVMAKQMLFSEEACEIISTSACCAATTSKAFATIPGMPCIPVPLMVTSVTCRIEVTALTPCAEGSPSTLTRVPG